MKPIFNPLSSAPQPLRSRLRRLNARGLILALLWAPLTALAAHGVAQFGEPKYPAGFSHFDYVNPQAPKGGTLNLSNTSQNSSFDKFNPFSLKGIAAPGVLELMFETLTVYSLDEKNTQYGLLAEDIQVAPDLSSVTFRLHPQARFSNGDPVTSRDVKHSFDTLTSRKASPRFKAYFSEIRQLTIIDSRTVRFDFTRKGRDLPFVAGSLPIFSPKWGKSDGKPTAFDQLRLETPITTGPYLIEKSTAGRGLTYRRNPDYWGSENPVRRGMFNFERVVYKLYKDKDTQVNALRSGDFDFFNEPHMRYWCCQYIGKRFDEGELVKQLFPHKNPPAMNGYAVNLRRDRFQDPRVRLALNYALDFEWTNQKIFNSEFTRVTSYFTGTPLAADGLPSAAELKLLEPYRAQLDAAVFGPALVQPNTRPPQTLRRNLATALKLFAEAGWHHKDGVLRNDKGEPFVIEISGSRGQSPFMDPFYLNLTKIGVVVRKKLTDSATGRSRMNKFDYDFTTINFREARMPGAELWRNFNSSDADVAGSENIIGVKSPVVDELIKKLLDANSEEEQITIGKALDRVLLHGHYILPWRYLKNHYFIYNKRLQGPAVLPQYYGANEWVIGTWWDRTAEKLAVK
ncbi:extracellular solute-binding protein [Janthinobacterium sp. 17J80-10]|uniref:extracellular solute-binding protein n=1 Tax=Janthinobacterium sp. 17J80-10 TaxID=2497863 RepID=UPI0010056AD8|nr:extracellular solute-binding protein [Janthinobacterium sp. 17J80-10]QAU33990.1 ABC transporter substrate-binding protein [Janthinobacterium sp. 17J80-10]